jgi:hypothetical protein
MEAGTAGRTNLAEKEKKGPPGPCSGSSDNITTSMEHKIMKEIHK